MIMKHPVKILIVEDEAITALALQMELKVAGFEVTHIVATGEEAVYRVNQCKPDVILMDVRLAGEVDGIEAAHHIISTFNIPIIFMTGYPYKELIEKTEQFRSIKTIIKPLQIDDLTQVIESLLKEKTDED